MISPSLRHRCDDTGPAGVPVLDATAARQLLESRDRRETGARVSPDLGLTDTDVSIGADGAVLGGHITISWQDLEPIAESAERCFAIRADGSVWSVGVFSEETGWYRSLIRTGGTPTTLVGGFTMHRIKDSDPMHDTREKIKAIRPVVGRVLDTATGLGYTAIQAAATADQVITVELDPAAIEIARYNPWSRDLFERDNICIVIDDVGKLIEELPEAGFDSIIHDPPTLSLAGELYSEAFYRQLRRVLDRRGRLFHYVGDPSSRSGRRTTDGVIRRLQAAGFERVRRAPRAFGVVAHR